MQKLLLKESREVGLEVNIDNWSSLLYKKLHKHYIFVISTKNS